MAWKNSIPFDEQETTVTYARKDKAAMVCTSDTVVIKKLKHLAQICPENYELEHENAGVFFFRVSKHRMAFRRTVSNRKRNALEYARSMQKENRSAMR